MTAMQTPPRAYKEVPPHIEGLCDDLGKAYALILKQKCSEVLGHVESPIEELFIVSLVAARDLIPNMFKFGIVGDRNAYASLPDAPDGIYIIPQAVVGKYRADFIFASVLAGEITKTMVVELDGHDFHERTKEQASRDKARDRFFASKGWLVMRYTGSDVWKDSVSPAFEVLNVMRCKVAK